MITLFKELYPLHRLLLRRSFRGSGWLLVLEFLCTLPFSGGIIIALEFGLLPLDDETVKALVLCTLVMLFAADIAMTGLRAKCRTLFMPQEFFLFPLTAFRRVLIAMSLLVPDIRTLVYAVPLVLHLGLILLRGEFVLAAAVMLLYATTYGILTLLTMVVVVGLRRFGGILSTTSSVVLLCVSAVMVLAYVPESHRWVSAIPPMNLLQSGLLASFRGHVTTVLVSTAKIVLWISGMALTIWGLYAMHKNVRGRQAMPRSYPA